MHARTLRLAVHPAFDRLVWEDAVKSVRCSELLASWRGQGTWYLELGIL